jgi:hypothetical protein
MHKKGEPLERALPDAGIERIRPVMITVGATIHALFPLALEGGPLWKPLSYAQIGGFVVAIFITLLLVPVFYSIFVLDLKWIKWEKTEDRKETTEAASQSRRLQLSGERRYLKLQRPADILPASLYQGASYRRELHLAKALSDITVVSEQGDQGWSNANPYDIREPSTALRKTTSQTVLSFRVETGEVRRHSSTYLCLPLRFRRRSSECGRVSSSSAPRVSGKSPFCWNDLRYVDGVMPRTRRN